jgi:hypothetical protein
MGLAGTLGVIEASVEILTGRPLASRDMEDEYVSSLLGVLLTVEDDRSNRGFASRTGGRGRKTCSLFRSPRRRSTRYK